MTLVINFFSPILSSLILESNKKVANWISAGLLSEIIKLFDTNFESTMSKLTNGRVICEFNNSVLVQKSSSSMDSNFILKFIYLQKIYLFGTVKLVRDAV